MIRFLFRFVRDAFQRIDGFWSKETPQTDPDTVEKTVNTLARQIAQDVIKREQYDQELTNLEKLEREAHQLKLRADKEMKKHGL